MSGVSSISGLGNGGGWHADVHRVNPFRAAPGRVPFADFLRAVNETRRSASPAAVPAPERPPTRPAEGVRAAGVDRGGWARLGEVPPERPAAVYAAHVIRGAAGPVVAPVAVRHTHPGTRVDVTV